jgi:hypothetical protein
MSLSAQLRSQREAKRARKASRRKPAERLRINPGYAYLRAQMAMARASNKATEERDVDELTEGPLAQLERLRTGKLDPTGFVEISEACAAACELGNELYRHATPDSKPLLQLFAPDIAAAGPVLDAIATRCNTTGKWVATGDEMTALRVVLGRDGVYEQFIRVADRGAVCRALLQAEKHIDQQLRKRAKA